MAHEHLSPEIDVQNALRDEQRLRVRDEMESRLRHRGVSLAGAESDEQILELSNAVDAFERAVMRAGGDLMIDGSRATEPENPAHVLPTRHADESVERYVGRVRAQADQITP